MDKYDIDFVTIIWHEIHKRFFGETMTFPFPCIIYRLCDKSRVLEIPSVYERVEVTAVTQTKLVKDPAHPVFLRRPRAPTIISLAKFEGPLVPKEPSDTKGGNMVFSMEFENGE